MADVGYTAVPIQARPGIYALIDSADWSAVSQHRWYLTRCPKSWTYYVRSPSAGYLHRFLLGLRKGDGIRVDHWDGDGLNCRRSNIRIASASQNGANARTPSNSSLGLKGVSFHRPRRKFVAKIRVQGQRFHLGYFPDPFAAADAYDQAALRHFGEYARTNADILLQARGRWLRSELRSLRLFGRFIHEGTPAPTADGLRPDPDPKAMVGASGARDLDDPPSYRQREVD